MPYASLDEVMRAFTKQWRYRAASKLVPVSAGLTSLQKRAVHHKAWINALRDEAERLEFVLGRVEEDLLKAGDTIPEYPSGEFLREDPFIKVAKP